MNPAPPVTSTRVTRTSRSCQEPRWHACERLARALASAPRQRSPRGARPGAVPGLRPVAIVAEPELLHLGAVVQVAAIDHHGLPQRLLRALQVEAPELVP